MRRFLVCFCWLWFVSGVQAQDTILSLQSETTALQTGQSYPVTIQIDNIQALWLATVEISYDPQMVYIIGTASGQPVVLGDVFEVGSLILDNQVAAEQLFFTASRVAPQDPFTGAGTLGTFQIFPLQAGTTRLVFRTAQMTKVNFVEQDGRRVGESTEALPFAPVLLDLTITGNNATPPPELTATPTASPTVDPALLPAEGTAPVEPTLVNITAVPRPQATPTPLTLLETPSAPIEASGTPLLALAAGAMLLGLLGLGVLVLRQRRR